MMYILYYFVIFVTLAGLGLFILYLATRVKKKKSNPVSEKIRKAEEEHALAEKIRTLGNVDKDKNTINKFMKGDKE